MHLIAGVEITLNSWSREKGAHVVLLNVKNLFDAWECVTAQQFSKEVFLSGYPIVESWKSMAYCEDTSPAEIFKLIKKGQVEPVWA